MQRLFKAFQGEVLAIPWRMILFCGGLLLAFVPLITREPYILRILTFTCVYAIYAASWDLLSGYAGQLSLGQALFFGVGAYTAAYSNTLLGLQPWATIPIGAVAAAVAGLVVGLPALRVRGVFLALVTLAFPMVATGAILAFPNVTGGDYGITGIGALSGSMMTNYYISLAVMVTSGLVMWKLTDNRSQLVRLGIILHGIREDEITVRASGINTVRYKLLVFGISGFFAGIAGALYAHIVKVVGTSTLELLLSLYPVIWTVFGGIMSIHGAIVGTFILYPLMEALKVAVPEVKVLIFAMVLIIVLLFMPEGLTIKIRDKIERPCPRCGLINVATRRVCRACGADLY